MIARYYEFELVTTGYMKVGFAKTTMEPGIELGMDGSSYAFDGHKVRAVAFASVIIQPWLCCIHDYVYIPHKHCFFDI